jgi:hypothetical protein
MCMLVNWTVGKRSRAVYRRRRDEALAWQLRVLFALSRWQRARTSSHAKLHLHDFEERASSFRKEERRRNIFFKLPARADHGYPRRRFKGARSLVSGPVRLLTCLVVFATPALPRQVVRFF